MTLEIVCKIQEGELSKYLEFDETLLGFKDGEHLLYRTTNDGGSVIVKDI